MAIGAAARPRVVRPLAWRVRVEVGWAAGLAVVTDVVRGAVVGAGAVGAGVGGPGSAPAMVDAGLRAMAGCLAAAGGGKAVMKSAGRLSRPRFASSWPRQAGLSARCSLRS